MTDRLICKKEACYILGISRATLDRRRVLPGFPRPIKGEKPTDRCWFRASELYAYIDSLPRG